MDNSELFKWLAIISPIASGVIVGIVTNILANRSKRIEMLYQHKIPAFKDIHQILIRYRSYLQINAYNNEFIEVPETTGSVETINLLDTSFGLNGIYFNKKSKKALLKLIGQINNMCNYQILVLQEEFKDTKLPYEATIEEIDKVIEVLYKDLNLK